MPYADREAQRAFQRERARRLRAEFFTGKCCAWCEATEALQLHHVDPAKKVSHKIWSWSKPRRHAEAAKCIVLCEPCHRRTHAEVRRLEAELRNPCGTWQAYKRGCKCAACRLANAERQRERKAA